MSVHGICDSKPDLVALVIALSLERVCFFASQVCRSGSMMRLHVTGVHQNRFFLRWKPHHATPYATILSATLQVGTKVWNVTVIRSKAVSSQNDFEMPVY
jgi:hypothetical protein